MTILVRRLNETGTIVSRPDSNQIHSGYVMLQPGEEVGEHSTESGEEVIVIFDGKAEVIAGEQVEVVEAPSVVLVRAHTVHDVRNASVTPLKYVYVVPVPRH